MSLRALPQTDRGRFLRFLAVGVLNAVVAYLAFAAMVRLGLHPQPALAAAFVIGILWNYQTHSGLVFGARGWRRMVPYAVAYLAVYGVNALSLWALLRLGAGPYLAQAILIPAMAALSYVLVSFALTGRAGVGGNPST